MTRPSETIAPKGADSRGHEAAWRLVLAAARTAESACRGRRRARFAMNADGDLVPADSTGGGLSLIWEPDRGWATAASGDSSSSLLDLYLPICSATAANPITVGHLGQSLDGFIATHTGDSRWVTGRENVVHMHRLRALCDAVLVGAGTVAADDPRLTTRLVPGSNPLRVVLDPGRRLSSAHRVFSDGSTDTLYVCARALVGAHESRFGSAEICPVDGNADDLDLAQLMQILRARGLTRVFVEGGGVTISAFLEAGLLDRLHLAIAPLLIGDGRAAIRLPAPAALGDCHRPDYRVFRMGGDVLFDCDLRATLDDSGTAPRAGDVVRII